MSIIFLKFSSSAQELFTECEWVLAHKAHPVNNFSSGAPAHEQRELRSSERAPKERLCEWRRLNWYLKERLCEWRRLNGYLKERPAADKVGTAASALEKSLAKLYLPDIIRYVSLFHRKQNKDANSNSKQ